MEETNSAASQPAPSQPLAAASDTQGQQTATVSQPVKSADAQAQQPQAPGSMIWVVLVVWVVVIYLFFMRPQKKKEKERREMLEQLKKGDEIVTIGGVCGKIVSINEQTAKIMVDEKTGTTVVFSRAAISGAPVKSAENS